MNDPSQKSEPMISKDTSSVTSSPASEDGATPSDLLDGPMIDLFGQEVVPVSPSVRRGKRLAPEIRAISGLPFSSSSKSAALQSSLENKLRVLMDGHGSILFTLIWKVQHTASGRRICALLASGHRTYGNVFTGWLTPHSHGPHNSKGIVFYRECNRQIARGQESLMSEASLLKLSGLDVNGLPIDEDNSDQLNPNHSRWLMGFPSTWALAGHMAMPSSRKSPKPSSKPTLQQQIAKQEMQLKKLKIQAGLEDK